MGHNTASPDEGQAILSPDELVMLAHLRMRQFSIRSALERMNRTDLDLGDVNKFIYRRFKTVDAFFTAMADEVHKRRAKNLLPAVSPPPRREGRKRYGFR